LLVLLLGLMGLLHRSLWIALLVAMSAAGAVRIRRWAVDPHLTIDARPQWADWLWLAAAPTLAMALLVATVPPGLLWRAEAGGYDVLEYHLNVPKEYFQSGNIVFLRHNAYSNMPCNAEMLYLLTMVLRGDVWQAASLAKMLNAALAILTAAAVWLAGRQFDRSTGLIAGLAAATCPWLVYLSGVAYVENGMLFAGSLAVATLLRWWSQRHDADAWRWAAATGLLVGLACGYKYTALALLAAPVLAVVAAMTLFGRQRRAVLLVLFALCGAITFGPWAAKNFRMTGNPLFPLAYRVFGAKAGVWDDQLAERWREGHKPDVENRPLVGRLHTLNHAVLGEARYGRYLPFALAVPILLSRRRRDGRDIILAWLVIAALLAWLALTHLVDRFAVLILPPLLLLVGRAWSAWAHRAYHALVAAGVAALVVLNVVHTGSLYYDHVRDYPIEPFGLIDVMQEHHWSHDLPADACVRMVGEARAYYVQRPVGYTVVFSPDALVEQIRWGATPKGLLRWLAESGWTHLFVDWAEMHRLRQTYGFWDELNVDLFNRMEAAGLTRERDLSDSSGQTYATLYRVPQS
jgi:4-amino-4-deoxy-L-arabinose transferase-like glycosyltransferase